MGYAEWRATAGNSKQAAKERAVPTRALALTKKTSDSATGAFFSREVGEEQHVQHDEVAHYST